MHNKEYVINPKTYAKYMRLMSIFAKRLHLNIKVHNNKNLFEEGQVFLFNHFARFETTIPSYLIYEATKSYCRPIAAHQLFKINDGLTNFIKDMGAIPNNLPGLLPFVAADILRGSKSIIFPEGGLIKDRKVMNDEGEFKIFSQYKNEYKQIHRGAAALALTLDVFKHRILDLFETGDKERIDHWCKALNIKTSKDLFAHASKPTVIVPATITFYPIRTDANLISRGLELFAKNIPQQLLEEMIIEGNILLKDTDMDIRFGEPITIEQNWPWWQKMILRNYFSNHVNALDDLFNLHRSADNWQQRLLVRSLSKETDRIRDAYVKSIYRGVMVNQGHLASQILRMLGETNITKITKDDFNKIFYLTLKALHKSEDIYLHRSLSIPTRYRDTLYKGNKDLDKFFAECEKSGLLKQNKVSYKLLPKLKQEHDIHSIRIENPVAVYANEVDPIFEIKQAIANAMAELPNLQPTTIAQHLFDDELIAFNWNKNHFDDEKYHDINNKQTATEDSSPYLLTQPKKAKIGVILVHGFLASPAELQKFGEKLHKSGYAVIGIRLAGHGTSPWDLHNRKWKEWLGNITSGQKILSEFADEIIVVGFSTGAALSLIFGAEKHKNIAGIVSICAPLAIQDKQIKFVPWMTRVNKLVSKVNGGRGVVPFYESDSEHPSINYRHIPIQALNELIKVMRNLNKKLTKITVPTLIIQSDADPVVTPDSADKIVSGLKNSDVTFHQIKSDRHGILNENVADTHKTILKFIKTMAKKR